MKPGRAPAPCELAVRVIIPSLRAMVAKELTLRHSMKQEDIASILGVTQSAVSQYVRSIRGKTLDLGDLRPIHDIVKETAELISKNGVSATYVNQRYCEACRIIRESRLLCALHKRYSPEFDIDVCESCLPSKMSCP